MLYERFKHLFYSNFTVSQKLRSPSIQYNTFHSLAYFLSRSCYTKPSRRENRPFTLAFCDHLHDLASGPQPGVAARFAADLIKCTEMFSLKTNNVVRQPQLQTLGRKEEQPAMNPRLITIRGVNLWDFFLLFLLYFFLS